MKGWKGLYKIMGTINGPISEIEMSIEPDRSEIAQFTRGLLIGIVVVLMVMNIYAVIKISESKTELDRLRFDIKLLNEQGDLIDTELNTSVSAALAYISMLKGEGSTAPKKIAQRSGGRGSFSGYGFEIEDDIVFGRKDAPVVIVEFSDFQCSFCSSVIPTVRKILNTYGEDVLFVYKDFPIRETHPDAHIAAEAVECAAEQGKFWAMHDTVFRNQQAIGVKDLKGYGQELGLDTDLFNNCLESRKYEKEVDNDYKDGVTAGVTSTPTFFINGFKIRGAKPYETFETAIEAVLGRGGGSLTMENIPDLRELRVDCSIPIDEDAIPSCALSDEKTYIEPAEVDAVDISGLDINDDVVSGSDNAPVTIIEFSDFQCPYCRSASSTIKEVLEAYGERVRYVYKDFPLSGIHPYAQHAAEAAECASDQGMFWEMHDMIFDNQQAMTIDDLKQHSKELGMDTETFNDCLESGKYEKEVKSDFNDGVNAGVAVTPTFFINGIKIEGAQPFDVFRKEIDRALMGQG